MIVVRTSVKWPCAVITGDVPEFLGDSSKHAVERLESVLDGCESVDEIHNMVDEYSIEYEPIDDVATIGFCGH